MVHKSGNGTPRGAEDARAAHFHRLLTWAVSLLPTDTRTPASAELNGTALAARARRFDALVRSRKDEAAARAAPAPPQAGPQHVIVALRAADTVLDADAVLAAGPVDWPALAAAHREEPFARTQRRALIARTDCPDEFTAALLTPWDPRVANRLVARRQELPTSAWWPCLHRIGETRPALLRHVLTEANLPEVLRSVRHIDALVPAVNGYDHNNVRAGNAFWMAVGTVLHARLGDDPSKWYAAARRFPVHHGTLEELIRGLGRPATGAERPFPDLRVLLNAPAEVVVAVVAGLGDEELQQAAEDSWRGVRNEPSFRSAVTLQLRAAGVPPRTLFARWAAPYRSSADCLWLYGLDEGLDERLVQAADRDRELRQGLAALRRPLPRSIDLVAELRDCTDAVAAQTVLDGGCGDTTTPWPELVRAHAAEPFPLSVLGTLAARPGFPDVLAQALPSWTRFYWSTHSPAAARATLSATSSAQLSGRVIHRIRESGVLDDESVLAAIRPARAALRHGHELPRDTADYDAWRDVCARLFRAAAERGGPGLWRVLAARLPDHGGSLPELLDAATAEAAEEGRAIG
ncbi:hypothetical protein ACFVH0_36345 [Streptomyces sp. NPDC127117]|uniref:hypothetical protein n=1 Tax=Streptomyces sp. NPDC127117 TaxID=3345368 RepID=UPI00364549B7